MNLIETLPEGPLDIVGDIHGERDALDNLLGHLGYDKQGHHPDGRRLVFIGDLFDRGPDSPGVFHRVSPMVISGQAHAIAGNHELNLLNDDAKDGAGWFFDERAERDQGRYAPFRRVTDEERGLISDWLATLPLALERADVRIVHAAWMDAHIEAVRSVRADTASSAFALWRSEAADKVRVANLDERVQAEAASCSHGLENPDKEPPMLTAHAERAVLEQMGNPVKVLSSGVERVADAPFYSSGKWRFAERVRWWDDYADAVPVIVGHYWRRLHPVDRTALGKGDADLFDGIGPTMWHGRHHNVFCVDYSVGGRWRARKGGKPVGADFKLAAMRWPERVLVFDDGIRLPTCGYRADGICASPD